MKGFFLFLIALISVSLVFMLSTAYSIIYHIVCFWKVKTAFKKIDAYFYQMALSIDQFGNVNCQDLFNRIMIARKWRNHKDQYQKFGDEDDTISYVLAQNNLNHKLSKFGTFWGKFLDTVDKHHLTKAIINKRKRDLEACDRIKNLWDSQKYKDLPDYTR